MQWEPDVKLNGRSLDLPVTLVDQVGKQLKIWKRRNERNYARGLSWLITEYNKNYVTLDDTIKIKKLNEYQKNKVMGSLRDTVSYLWDRYKFCHWDLHPGNVLFDQISFEVVMFDFDLSTVDATVDEDNLRFSDYIFRLSFLKNIICHMTNLELKKNPDLDIMVDLQKNLQKVGHYYDILNIYVDFNKPIKDGLAWPENLMSRIGGLEWPENLTSHPKRQPWKELTEQGFDKRGIPYKVPKWTGRVKDGKWETVDVTPDGHFIYFGWMLLQMIDPPEESSK